MGTWTCKLRQSLFLIEINAIIYAPEIGVIAMADEPETQPEETPPEEEPVVVEPAPDPSPRAEQDKDSNLRDEEGKDDSLEDQGPAAPSTR